MSPALAQKNEQRAKRRKAKSEAGTLDRWASPEARLRPSSRFKSQSRGEAVDAGPRFQSSASGSGRVFEKARHRRDERHQRSSRDLRPLPISVKPERTRGDSPSPPLDRAVIQLKRLAYSQDIGDEDFVTVARALREAMKAQLHTDPPMADVCLVVSDALTFSVPERLDSAAFGALVSVLPLLVERRAAESDPRQVFSSLLQAGWQMTPAFEDAEFVGWAEEMTG